MQVSLKKRSILFLFIFLLALVGLIGRVFWLQFVKGDELAQKSSEQVVLTQTLNSPRGAIYDRNGAILAVSLEVNSLYADPSGLKEQDVQTIADLLAPILKENSEDIQKLLQSSGTFVFIKRKLDEEQYVQVKTVIKEYKIQGLGFVKESKRYYPNKQLLSQTIGFVGTDDNGLAGLEAFIDDKLKGKRTARTLDTDNHGQPILKSVFSYKPSKKNTEVYLTVDRVIQYIVEKALDTAMEKTKAQAGTVIVMNVKTGEILAMANRPAYDPNSFSQYSSETWKNRAISLVYEPGSTFKTVISAAALEENIVNKDTMFHDKGYYDVSGHTIKNWSGESYGDVTFLEVMKNSINTCFIQVGMKLGPEKLTDYAKKFGFGKATGIDLAGEEAGLLFDPAEMGGSDIATMSIGQSIAVTPIQMVTAFSAIANGGVLLKPYIVKEYHEFDADNENPTIQKFEPQSLGRVMGEKTSADLRYMLEKVVSEGGGSKAQVKGYRFAGKTGTAEKLRQSGYGYESGVYIASFAGFGPIDDIRYAAIVVIDSPQGVYYGGQIAAPVFSEIMSQIMYYEKMPKQN